MNKKIYRRVIYLVVIILVIFFAFYLLKGNFFKGTLILEGSTPFSVKVLRNGEFFCDSSPCEVEVPLETVDLIIEKEGYQVITEKMEIGFLRENKLVVDFDAAVTIVPVESIPKIEQTAKYQLVFDQLTNRQKLILKDDSLKRAIVYFSKEIKNPKIIPGKDFVLVMSRNEKSAVEEVYKIEVNLNKKKVVKNFSAIKELKNGKFSLEGNFLVFNKNDSDGIYLYNFNKQKVLPLSIRGDLAQIFWFDGEQFLFLTNQTSELYFAEGKSYLKLKEEVSADGTTIGIYHPTKDSYQQIGIFEELKILPSQAVVSSNGKYFYFQAEDKNFVLNF